MHLFYNYVPLFAVCAPLSCLYLSHFLFIPPALPFTIRSMTGQGWNLQNGKLFAVRRADLAEDLMRGLRGEGRGGAGGG